MRPLYFDPERPDLAIVFVMSGGAGMVQGDRYRIDVTCAARQRRAPDHPGRHQGACGWMTTTRPAPSTCRRQRDACSSTCRTRSSRARDRVSYHRARVTVAAGATAIVGETLRAGRLAHGDAPRLRRPRHRPRGSPPGWRGACPRSHPPRARRRRRRPRPRRPRPPGRRGPAGVAARRQRRGAGRRDRRRPARRVAGRRPAVGRQRSAGRLRRLGAVRSAATPPRSTARCAPPGTRSAGY